MNQTQRDYYDALSLAAPRLGAVEVRRLATQVTLIAEPDRRFLYAARPEWHGSDDMAKRRVVWRVGRDVSDLQYRIERLELMLELIARSSAWLYGLTLGERNALCKSLECDTSLIVRPRERWRRLWAHRDLSQPYLLEPWDDRPRCRVCKRLRVPSGHALPDRHDNCSEFLTLVLLPALAAQRASLTTETYRR